VLAVASTAIVLLFASPAGAEQLDGTRHVVERAGLGNVEADFSYFETSRTETVDYGGKKARLVERTYTRLRVSMFVGGKLLLSQVLNRPGFKPLGRDFGKGRSIRVVRIAAGESPVALLDLYSGGAHCCIVTDIYVRSGATYRGFEHDWADPGYRLLDADGDGELEFTSEDAAFDYAFTSYAESGRPVQIWHLQGGKLVDATRSFPGEIRRDAARWWKAYLQRRADSEASVRGILGAWAADEALLGRWDVAQNGLQQALARGDLDQGFNLPGESAARYLAHLHALLIRAGYLS
jgi:hypothetical protein